MLSTLNLLRKHEKVLCTVCSFLVITLYASSDSTSVVVIVPRSVLEVQTQNTTTRRQYPPVPYETPSDLKILRVPDVFLKSAPKQSVTDASPQTVRILITRDENFPVSQSALPCGFPTLTCETYIDSSGYLNGDSVDLLPHMDVVQVDANSLRSYMNYDIVVNPLRKYIMMTTWENWLTRDVQPFYDGNWWIGHLWKYPENWKHFAISSTHEKFSTVPYNTWVDYTTNPLVRALVNNHTTANRPKKHPLSMMSLIVSHPGQSFNWNGKQYTRVSLAAELDPHVGVTSYGSTGPTGNQNMPNSWGCSNKRWNMQGTLCLISHHYFHLAIENSVSYDYVTEKVYMPLWVGTVPIYMGAPNIDNYIPPRSVIKLTDFENVTTLVYYLNCIVNDKPELYEFYLDWRSREHNATYWQRYKSQENRYCTVCRLVANRDSALQHPQTRIPQPFTEVLPEAANSQAPFQACLP